MGTSKNACLSIFACAGAGSGGTAGAAGDAVSDESKAISDKSHWSFRRRSTRHRVLKNTEISEPETVNSNKEISGAVTDSFYLPQSSPAPEKAFEKENPTQDSFSPAEAHSEVINSTVTEREGTPSDQNHLDAAAVVIQAGTRAYLARRELSKLKSVVELQAAIRGDLVRKQAVVTLKCLNAIIKLQALVLARQSKQLVEKFSGRIDKILQVKGRSSMQEISKCTNEKLLSNGFARRVMAMPKTRSMDIKCDPSKSDSTWKWLERWTVATSCNIRQLLDQDINESADKKAVHEVPRGDDTLTCDSGMLETENSGTLGLHAPPCVPDNSSVTSANPNQELEFLETTRAAVTQDNVTKTETVAEKASTDFSCLKTLQTDAPNDKISFLDAAQSYDDVPKNASQIEPLEAEGKKCVTRKQCNPAFAAAQLKFQVLSSNSTVNKPTNSSSSCPDGISKVRSFVLHSQADASTKVNNGICVSENSVTHDTRAQNAASECGTEISISSTLDSPDISETEGGEIVLEIGSLEKRDYDNSGGAENEMKLIDMHAGPRSFSMGLETRQVKRLEEEDENTAVDPVQVEQHAGVAIFEDQDQLKPEGTPRSHTIVTEPNGTPSNQISENTKKRKKDDGMPVQRQRLNTIIKSSLSSPNSNSVGRISTENLPKDLKSTKRQSSTGMAKSDPVDHEPRISNGHPLPSYMQATESARAKVHASISPKLSPDIHDNHVKKRHSLPMGNGKQDSSPCMQRSTSQAQQNSKGNGTHSAHSSAEKRWQI